MKTERERLLRTVFGLAAAVLCLLLARRFLLQDRCITVALAILDRLGILGWTALILAASLSFGCGLLEWLRLRPARAGATALFGVGLGLGALSFITLGLGVLGLTHNLLLLAVLLAMLFAGLRAVGRVLREVPPALARARKAGWFRIVLWGVLLLFAMMNLTRAYEPPWDYDSLEYHVAAPAAYDRAGRVFFMRDNVYANFPQNTEILYFLAMRLTASPDRGALVGQMLGAAMGLLAALALRAMLRGVAGKETGDIGALLFYSWSGVTVYSGMPYVELPLIFYGTLALWALLWSWRRKRTAPGARGWVALSALATGLALGVKYTAALLILAPFIVWLLVAGLLGLVARKEAVRRAAAYAGIALLVFSPWLVRNFANTRNPVYPLLYKVFGSTNWDSEKDARWTRAHSPRDRSPATLSDKATEVTFYCSGKVDEWKASLLMVLFVPLLLLAERRTRGIALVLALHAAVLFMLWFLFTQHNARFLEVGIAVPAALSAIGLGALMRTRYASGLQAIFIVLLLVAPSRWDNYRYVQHSLAAAVWPDEYRADLEQSSRHRKAMSFINDKKNLPPGSKILFLGEAKTFYCRREHVASTVFDSNLLEGIVGRAATAEEIRRELKARAITHLYVDTFELWRLQESYRFQHQGSERLGMLNDFNWALFDTFARQYLRPVKVFAGNSARFQWSKWNQAVRDYISDKGPKHPPAGHIVAVYALE